MNTRVVSHFEPVAPVHSKVIIVELFEFFCIKFHSSVRVYELLPNGEAKVAVKVPQQCSLWLEAPKHSTRVNSCVHPRGSARTTIYLLGLTGCPAHAGAGWGCLWSFASSLAVHSLGLMYQQLHRAVLAWIILPGLLASPSVSAAMVWLICQLNKLPMDNPALAVLRRKWAYLAHCTVTVQGQLVISR